ncbi:RHS repeat-associated core domain-containing protein [Frankia sp. ArI3]|uniref:RHS repeat-associated core domain-containing protein n=1 Tax=Frankia sp. ArI3 TaxID=1858 RepID=UPI0021074EB5|nr:RHS repeat-associated core domain-containing protein [Frankia sp. ArI3]
MNDLVASETVGSSTRTYALDPARRIRSWTDGSTTSTNHYTSASGDSPAWIGAGTAWTRNITGIGGDLAATQTDTGTVTLQLANLHGDVVATVDDSTSASSPASYAESTEFGSPYFPSTAYPRYGWLGAKQRSRDTDSGLTLMGVRLYDPSLGRFLQTDPEPGGSDNPYDYAHQDPYNTFDLDGKCIQVWRKHCRGKKSVWARGGRLVKAAYAHTEIGFSGCFGVCWGMSAQGLGTKGGALNQWWGWGCCSLGVNYGYSPRRYSARSCQSATVSLPAGYLTKGRSRSLRDVSFGRGVGVGSGAAVGVHALDVIPLGKYCAR